MEEVPRPKLPFLALHDQHALTGDDQKALLCLSRWLHRHRLARLKDADVDPDLRETALAFKGAEPAQWAIIPPP